MRCHMTGFDCITCDDKCKLMNRPCNQHERIYEDGSGYICRNCGVDMDPDFYDENESN